MYFLQIFLWINRLLIDKVNPFPINKLIIICVPRIHLCGDFIWSTVIRNADVLLKSGL